MKVAFDLFSMVTYVCFVWFTLWNANDHETRLTHLESVTFESSRCPNSLINLRS